MTLPREASRMPGQLLRFVLLGGANTLITGVLLAVLMRVLAPPVAYTVVFVAGLVGTTLLTGRVVFRARLTWRRGIAFVAIYVAIYVWGRVVIEAAPSILGESPNLLAAAVIVATAPLSFLGGRYVFERRREHRLRTPDDSTDAGVIAARRDA